jgi:hypothetical protein
MRQNGVLDVFLPDYREYEVMMEWAYKSKGKEPNRTITIPFDIRTYVYHTRGKTDTKPC